MAKKQPPYRVVTPFPKDYVLKDPVVLQIFIRAAIRKLQAERSVLE